MRSRWNALGSVSRVRLAHQQQPQRRIQRERKNGRAQQRKALGVNQRPEQLAFLAFQHQHRQKRHRDHQQRKERGPRHFANGFEDHGFVGKRLARTLMQFQLLVGLLHHHDGRIDQFAAGQRDPGKRKNIDAHAQVIERNKRDQHRHRNGHHRNNRAGEVPQENQDHHHHGDDDFHQRAPRIGDGPLDQLRSVVDRHHAYAGRHARRDLVQPRLHVLRSRPMHCCPGA